MNICIPSQDDRGLDSQVHDHFGSAPWFTIVNSGNDQAIPVRNPSCHQSEGCCHHIDMLRAEIVAVVVSSGMGQRAAAGTGIRLRRWSRASTWAWPGSGVSERLETYERMWDGCGCKIDYLG